MKKILTLSLVLALVGCGSTVPMSSPQTNSEAKLFKPKADSAGVYIYRNESLGKLVKMHVEVDGKTIGQTGHMTFFFLDLPPGLHKVTTRAENTSEITFQAMAGKLHYIWQEIKMGVFGPRAELHVVDETTGQKAVMETNMAQPVQ
jgi:hypothetical protein